MPFYTPLRYPGGKRRLATVVMRLLEENRLKDIQYAEPFAGGSAVALSLLFEEYASVVHINDLSRPIYAFWFAALNDTAELCRRLLRVRVTMAEWRKQRAVYDSRDSANLTELGFATLFLNRANRSGIISGGVIGGKEQTGKWLLDARFRKDELIERIRRIGRCADRIRLYQQDALAFTEGVIPALGANTFAFFDPPYIESGSQLYLNTYKLADHIKLAEKIAALKQPWIVTYDHAAVKFRLYSQRRVIYGLHYSAQVRSKASEVMFVADCLKLPRDWRATRYVPINKRRPDQQTVYGIMEAMKPHPKMEEGPRAADRFMRALRTVLTVPKGSVPSPFHKPRKRRKPAARKG